MLVEAWIGWTLLAVAAMAIGIAKTAIGPLALIATALATVVLPARPSTGFVLLLLIAGDIIAVFLYRQHVQWALLIRLIPSVAIGLCLGTGFMWWADDAALRRAIGVLLLCLVALHLWVRRRPATTGHERVPAGVYGAIGGFSTMVANSGGPPLMLYISGRGLSLTAFMGTLSWFFFTINVIKLPIAISLGQINVGILTTAALVLPALIAGALVGRRILHLMSEEFFTRLIVWSTVLISLYLIR